MAGAGLLGECLTITEREGHGEKLMSRCMVCFGLLVALVLSLFFEETFVPAILANDAKRQRHETGNWAWHSAVDRIRIRPKDVVSRYLLRPLKMLITEPSMFLNRTKHA